MFGAGQQIEKNLENVEEGSGYHKMSAQELSAVQEAPGEQEAMKLKSLLEKKDTDSAEEAKEAEETAPSAFMHRVASAAAVPARMFKSAMDQLRRPFAVGSLAHALRENLAMADEQRHFALLGEEFPDLVLESTHGRLQLHKYFGSGWGILLTHPKAFDPVSLTEFAAFASELGHFHQRATKLCAVSTDTVEAHLEWAKDLASFRSDGSSTPQGMAGGEGFPIPFMTDPKRTFAHRLGVLDTKEEDEHGEAMMSRAVFIIGPDRKLRFSQVYPHACGRSAGEILRVLSALQSTENRPVAAPVGWTPGRALLVDAGVDLGAKDVLFPLGATEHHLPHQTIWSTPDPQVEERTVFPSAVEYKPQAHHVSMLNLGDELPNFHMKPVGEDESGVAQPESGVARYLEHCSWGIVCPLADPLSPACLTELASALTHIKKFVSRKCKLVFLTAKPLSREHMEDVIAFSQGQYHPRVLPFAIVVDPEREIIDGLGSLDEKTRGENGSAGVARGVFIVHGHDLKLRLSMLYPASVARNWTEVLRAVDALALTDAAVGLLTPEGWTSGNECVADGTMKQDEVQTFFPESMTRPAQLASRKDYLVYVKDPTNVTSVH